MTDSSRPHPTLETLAGHPKDIPLQAAGLLELQGKCEVVGRLSPSFLRGGEGSSAGGEGQGIGEVDLVVGGVGGGVRGKVRSVDALAVAWG